MSRFHLVNSSQRTKGVQTRVPVLPKLQQFHRYSAILYCFLHAYVLRVFQQSRIVVYVQIGITNPRTKGGICVSPEYAHDFSCFYMSIRDKRGRVILLPNFKSRCGACYCVLAVFAPFTPGTSIQSHLMSGWRKRFMCAHSRDV